MAAESELQEGETVWVAKYWKERPERPWFSITAHIVFRGHVRFGAELLRLGHDVFRTEQEAKARVQRAATHALHIANGKHAKRRAELVDLIHRCDETLQPLHG